MPGRRCACVHRPAPIRHVLSRSGSKALGQCRPTRGELGPCTIRIPKRARQRATMNRAETVSPVRRGRCASMAAALARRATSTAGPPAVRWRTRSAESVVQSGAQTWRPTEPTAVAAGRAAFPACHASQAGVRPTAAPEEWPGPPARVEGSTAFAAEEAAPTPPAGPATRPTAAPVATPARPDSSAGKGFASIPLPAPGRPGRASMKDTPVPMAPSA
jgi:hypothetical protein